MLVAHRILHLIDTGGPGGAETICSRLAAHFSSEDWRSVVAVPERDWLYHELLSCGISPIALPSHRRLDVALLRRMMTIVGEEDIDLIHAHLLGSAVYGSLVGALSRRPVVATFHGRPDIPRRGGLAGSIKSRILGSRHTHTVCVSADLRDFFVKKQLLPVDTDVVPNGVRLPRVTEATRIDFRSTLSLSDECFIVGALGNIRTSKDYPTLLRAMKRLIMRDVPAELVIAGHFDPDGVLYQELTGSIQKLGIERSVHFLGFRDDVFPVLRGLDAFALSSTDEGFSLSLVQALAAGTPVVATRSGGPTEIVGHSRGAILVPTRDDEQLASALADIWRHPAKAKTMASRGQSHVREHFSEERMLQSYETLYRRVLSTH